MEHAQTKVSLQNTVKMFSSQRIPRGLLLFLLIAIVIVVLRALFNVPFNGSKTKSAEISMLTFNIYYQAVMMEERMQALGQVVEDLDPDFLLFQEVTLVNLALLRKQSWFSRYYLIPPKVTQIGKHFVVTFSRYPVDNWKSYPFKNSPYDRHLLVTETKGAVLPKNVLFVVANTHLEHSKKNSDLREEHLGQSLEILSKYDNVCVMGDMNILLHRDGLVVLPQSWTDVWLSIPGNNESNGYTWTSKNPFISLSEREVSAHTETDRVDRVYCKLSDFKVKKMRIVDDQFPIPGARPSDHFGLFTVLELMSEKTAQKRSKSSKAAEGKVYFKELHE